MSNSYKGSIHEIGEKAMPEVSLLIPQIGEGLHEARLVATLKKPGDKIHRDEPIYQMETDKAVMDVESPYEGVLIKWTAEVDSIVPIGGVVALIETTSAGDASGESKSEIKEEVSGSSGEAGGNSQIRLPNVPPRTRAYAKSKGVSDGQLAELSKSKKLMPDDIDTFLKSAAPGSKEKGGEFEEIPMSSKQRILSSRLQRGSQLVVPGTISVAVKWDQIERQRAIAKDAGSDFQPSTFTMFSFAVVKALIEFPSFRTTFEGENNVRTYRHVNLGIAVGLPGDELVIAAVEDADTLSWVDFAKRTREKIELARGGRDQISESVIVSLTNMQNFKLRDAVPVVVPPSVATIFLGEVYLGLDQDSQEMKMRRFANIAMTFDHRLVNGVGAANFINLIKKNVETIETIL